jgi:hypothetical protein
MDKGFLKIIGDFWNDKLIFRRQPYTVLGHCNPEEKEILQMYFHYKIFKWTKFLVFATWGLAIASILILFLKSV